MTTFNINENEDQKITTIVGIIEEDPHSLILELDGPSMIIEGRFENIVRIPTKEAALNLIKALNKAIELNWVV